MIKFFWMPKEVWYYVIIPIGIILLFYIMFSIFYKKKKDSYYYNYIVDYVYSTCGIIFCSLLFCLLFGYSIATIQILVVNNLLNKYLFLVIVISILPLIPSIFLVYIIRIYLRNLKRKDKLDNASKNYEVDNKEINNDISDRYEETELIKKNS